MDMNMVYWILIVLMVLTMIYISMKKGLPYLAEKGKFFTTVKPGRVIAVGISGNAQKYYSNLKERHADRETGEMKDGPDPDMIDEWLWQEFGIIFIGFHKVFQYRFKKIDMEGDAVNKVDTMADSMFEKNRFIVTVKDAETEDKISITIVAQLEMRLVQAKLTLECDNWVAVAEARVMSACRDYISDISVEDLTKEKLEDGGGLHAYIIKSLSDDIGNLGLKTVIGQEVKGFSVITLEITDKAYIAAWQSEATEVAAAKGKLEAAKSAKAVSDIAAEAKLNLAIKEAEGIEKIGDSRNKVLEKTAKLITKSGAADLERSRALADAIKGNGSLKALSIGGGSQIPFLISDDEKKK